MAQLLEDHGFEVERKFGLGATLIGYEALVNGEIDVYPEYSGTIEQAILKLPRPESFVQLQNLLKKEQGLELLDSFGFKNTYAITVRADMATTLNLKTISDLRSHSDLRFGLSYEFLERGDGWRALAKAYALPHRAVGMEHSLSYQALDDKSIDVIDVYSTDAEIQRYDLVLLADDKNFFPKYLAAPLVRSDLKLNIKMLLKQLSGKLNEKVMQQLKAQVAISNKSFAESAHDFLLACGLLKNENAFNSAMP